MTTPEDWETRTIGELCSLQMGQTILNRELSEDGVPVFSAAATEEPWGYIECPRKVFHANTIIVGARGTIGNPRIPEFDEYVSTQTTIALIPNDKILPSYLVQFLKTIDFNLISSKQAIPMLTIRDLKDVAVAVPPMGEQKRISHLLNNVERSVKTTQKVINKIEQLKHNCLDVLLKSGLRHTQHKETEIGNIPESWDLVRLGNVSETLKYGTSKKSTETQAGTPVLRIPNVVKGFVSWVNLKYAWFSEKEKQRYLLKTGDLLAIRTNGNPALVGRMALIEDNTEAVFASYLIRIRPDKSKVVPEYLLYCSRSNFMRRSLVGFVRTSAGNYNINITGLSAGIVPLPSLAEQRDIIDRLDRFDTTLDKERKRLAILRNIRGRLLAELLTGQRRLPMQLNDAAE